MENPQVLRREDTASTSIFLYLFLFKITTWLSEMAEAGWHQGTPRLLSARPPNSGQDLNVSFWGLLWRGTGHTSTVPTEPPEHHPWMSPNLPHQHPYTGGQHPTLPGHSLQSIKEQLKPLVERIYVNYLALQSTATSAELLSHRASAEGWQGIAERRELSFLHLFHRWAPGCAVSVVASVHISTSLRARPSDGIIHPSAFPRLALAGVQGSYLKSLSLSFWAQGNFGRDNDEHVHAEFDITKWKPDWELTEKHTYNLSLLLRELSTTRKFLSSKAASHKVSCLCQISPSAIAMFPNSQLQFFHISFYLFLVDVSEIHTPWFFFFSQSFIFFCKGDICLMRLWWISAASWKWYSGFVGVQQLLLFSSHGFAIHSLDTLSAKALCKPQWFVPLFFQIPLVLLKSSQMLKTCRGRILHVLLALAHCGQEAGPSKLGSSASNHIIW